MDGITEGNFVQESTYLYIIFCITWFFVLTNFSLKKYSFLPHPQSRSENVMGYLVGRTLLENPSVMELFLWSEVLLVVKNAGLEPEYVGSYSIFAIY